MAQKGLEASRGSTGEIKRINIKVIGDPDCGRTALIITFRTGVFPEVYIPSVSEHVFMDIVYEGQQFELLIKEISITEGYDRLRPLSYSYTDVVLICYDVMSPSSFDNVFQKWYPEVKHLCDGVPIILVGCKTDLRSDKFLEEGLWLQGQKPIKYTQGEEAARKISAAAYLECSAKCNKNVDNVFREAARQALMAKRVKHRVRKSESRCALS